MNKVVGGGMHVMKGDKSAGNLRLHIEVVGIVGVLAIENVVKSESILEIFKVVSSMLSNST